MSHGLGVLALHPDADVVIGATWRWYSWTGDTADRRRDHVMRLPDVAPLTVIEPPALFAGMYAKPGAWRVPAMCSLLVSRRALLRIGGLDDSFRGLYEDQVLYTKIAMHLRAVVDPRPMGLYRQHDASACQVAVDAGVWRRSGPSEPERRYLEWVRTYVTEGGRPRPLAVVARNLDHAAHGQHVAPTEPSPSLRSRRTGPAAACGRSVAGAAAGAADHRRRSLERAVPGADQWLARRHDPRRRGANGGRRGSATCRPTSSAAVRSGVVEPGDDGGGRASTGWWCRWRSACPWARSARADGCSRLAPTARRTSSYPVRRWTRPAPTPPPWCDLVQAVLPHRRVEVESFGNETRQRALDAPAAAFGPVVDRHDPAVPAVLGITITPARCGR